MKIQQDKLSKKVSNVIKAHSTRSTLPILAYIKFDVSNGKLTMTCSDLEKTYVETLDIDTQEEWSKCVPVRLFSELVSAMPGEIEIVNNENSITLVNNNDEANIKTMGSTEFPTLPELPDVEPVEIESSELVYVFSNVAFAAATDESRPTLNGVYFEFGKDKMFASAADGFRLAYCEYPLGVKLPNVIIPVSFLSGTSGIRSILADANCKVKVYTTETQITLVLPETKLVSQLVSGNFPAVIQLIPKSHNVKATLKSRPLIAAIKKLMAFVNDKEGNVITAEYLENSIELYADGGEMGQADATIEAQVEGDSFKSAFNGRLMLDALSTVGNELVVKQERTNRPFVVSPVGKEEQIIQIIMPLQLRERKSE